MGRLVELSDALAARAATISGLEDACVVFRGDNVTSLFGEALRKSKGLAVVVRLVGGKNAPKKPKNFSGRGTYTVTVFRKSILKPSAATGIDELAELLAAAINGWWPSEVASNGGQWCEVTDIAFPNDDAGTFAIARLTIEAPGPSNP